MKLLASVTLIILLSALSTESIADDEKCKILVNQYNTADLHIAQLSDSGGIIAENVQAASKTSYNAAITSILLSQNKMLFLMKELDCDFDELSVDNKANRLNYIELLLLNQSKK